MPFPYPQHQTDIGVVVDTCRHNVDVEDDDDGIHNSTVVVDNNTDDDDEDTEEEEDVVVVVRDVPGEVELRCWKRRRMLLLLPFLFQW